MTTPPLDNVSKFYLKLNAFHVDCELTDITIKCADDENSFRCHRLSLATASDYFKDMFGNSIKEHTTEISIVLREVNSATFQEVLRFIHAGDAKLDCDNCWDVFRASKLFRLSGLRHLCISFVKQNIEKFTMKNFLIMYLYAHENEDDMLTDILRPRLVDRLEMFCKANEFLELPSNALREIIKQILDLLAQGNRDRAVVAAITRWARHIRRDQSEETQELVTFILSRNITPEFEEHTTTGPLETDKYTPQLSNSTPLAVLGFGVSPSKALYVYVLFLEEYIVRVFSIDSSTKIWNPIGTISSYDPDQDFTTVVPSNDDFLYRLDYYGEQGPFPGEDHQTFFACTSANMQTAVPLKRPPIHFECVSLGAIQNNIYAYHETQTLKPLRTRSRPNSRAWNDEEIARGIFAYNCEVDDWFPVPAMRKPVKWASATVLADTLFIVGGYSNDSGPFNRAQAYDSREGVWQELPPTSRDYYGASACCLHEKIYIFGGYTWPSCERYDPVAGRWERLEDMVDNKELSPKSVAFGHKIWLFDRVRPSSPNDDSPTEYNLYFQTSMDRWDAESLSYIFSWRSEFAHLNFPNPTHCVDCVVFKRTVND